MSDVAGMTSASLSEAEFFSSVINYAIDYKYSVALWQLPKARSRCIAVASKHEYLAKDSLLENLPPGFIFAPFDRDSASIFIKSDFYFEFSDEGLKYPESQLENDSLAWFNDKVRKDRKMNAPAIDHNHPHVLAPDKSHFLDLVSKGIEHIEKGNCEKVVTSRFKTIPLPDDFDIITAFEKLCSRYPHALVSFVSIPGVGRWLGASPELLVSVENKTIFKTIALAGTKVYTDDINLKTVAWTQKEIEEQALVERYIISCFKKIRIREYDEHGPRTVVAGNVMHLKSEFTVDMKATNFPQLGSVMLQLLHPTSAVCGVPLEASRNFLREHEDYDRQFYAGYLGPVNVNNDIHVFVNIRCMQLWGDQAICYAGAGVTIDSVPEEEWNETEIKLKTILNIL
jgi:isochorismate synthase